MTTRSKKRETDTSANEAVRRNDDRCEDEGRSGQQFDSIENAALFWDEV